MEKGAQDGDRTDEQANEPLPALGCTMSSYASFARFAVVGT